MQRLFSMFPTGRAGTGLLLLRLALTASVFADAFNRFQGLPFEWLCLLLFVVGASLAVGLFTPFFSALAFLMGIARLLYPDHAPAFEDVLATLNAASVGLLGPGGYSVDARLFGRRIVSLLPGGRQTGRKYP